MAGTLDDQLQQVVRISRRTVFSVALATVILFAAGLTTAVVLLVQANQRIASDCAFYRDLGTAPLTVHHPAGKPTRLGVTIVADSRNAYYGHGCQPEPLPPNPSLYRWAGYYHVALTGQ
jgi:hypothetical protein